MSRVRGIRCAAGVAAAAVLAAGCGAGVGASARDVVEDAASAKATAPSARPTPSGSAAPTPEGESPRRWYLTPDQLAEALVGDDAFPVGWRTQLVPDDAPAPAGSDRPVLDKPECENSNDLLHVGHAEVPATGSAAIVAASPADRALSGVTVAAFGSGDAGRLIATVRDLVPRCMAYKSTQGGKKFSVELTSMPLSRMGDESYAMAIVTRPDKGSPGFAHTAAVVRVGDVLIETTYVNLAGPSPEMPDEELLQLQIDRVEAVLAGKPVPRASGA